MNRIAKWLAITILIGVFLFSSLGSVAALDELAKLPFYNTLPVAALLINSVSLFLFFRRQGRFKNASRAFAKLSLQPAMLFRRFTQ